MLTLTYTYTIPPLTGNPRGPGKESLKSEVILPLDVEGWQDKIEIGRYPGDWSRTSQIHITLVLSALGYRGAHSPIAGITLTHPIAIGLFAGAETISGETAGQA